ncbi:hypothetical protein BOTCAL_0212g00210 [Botryotinia calthae]|uniref:Uncharacterized protein n=1 Tax=Botryotinia calthae TaxID=38488 RepID=A0A4Y8CYP8_9HELO|nr:hypothetical protein BOTCAL_0212g00210 [Botryotinia calthae]
MAVGGLEIGLASAEDHDAPMHGRQRRSCRPRFKASVALKIPNFEDLRFKEMIVDTLDKELPISSDRRFDKVV